MPAFIVSIGDREVVHVFQASAEMEVIFATLPAADQVKGWNTGRLHHVEFWATDLDAVAERRLPDKYQVQMNDPDGIEVNLNVPLSEAPASA